MDCEQALAILMAHMDRELQPEDRPRLEAHFRECANCRASAGAYRLQDADLRRAFAARRQASAVLASRVIVQVRATSARARRRPPWLAVILSAAAGFLIAALLFRPWAKSPAPIQQGGQELAATQGDRAPKPETVLLALATRANQACEILAPNEKVWQALRVGGEIVLGTRVRTNPEVRCEFHTRDGSEVRVNGGTELVFSAKRRLDLDKGQILARVAEADSPFRVSIPNATVTARGTEFDILCKPAETILTVLEGATKVEGKDQWHTIQTGEQATIVDGLVIRKQLLRQYGQVVNWSDELLKLRGPTDKQSERHMSLIMNDLFAHLGEAKIGEFSDDELRSLGPHVVLPLTRYLQSERSKSPQEERKRHRAARLLADMAQPWSVVDLIELLGDSDKQVRFYAAVGLKRLTRETLGHEPDEWRDHSLAAFKGAREEWRKWWLKNRDRFPDGAHASKLMGS